MNKTAADARRLGMLKLARRREQVAKQEAANIRIAMYLRMANEREAVEAEIKARLGR